MRLGIAIRRLKPFGGREQDCLALAAGLAEAGDEVIVLARDAEQAMPPGVRFVSGGAAAPMDQDAPAQFAAWLGDLIRRQAFDALLSFEKGPADCYFAAEACLAGRLDWRQRWLPANRQALHLEKATFDPGGPHILFPSDAHRRAYSVHYALEPGRFTILPPIVPQRPGGAGGFYSERERLRTALGIPKAATMAVHIATAPFEKGTDRAIAVVAALPGLYLVAAGDRRAELQRRQAQELGCADRVWFLDAPDDPTPLIAAADLMLHPARTEIAGRILIDSLVAGVPAATLVDCAMSDQIRDYKAGVVAPSPFDLASFTALIGNLILPPRLDAARRNARRASVMLTNAGQSPAVDLLKRAISEAKQRRTGAEAN
ncbi:MAG: glycosyltransferase [Bauldia sp.]